MPNPKKTIPVTQGLGPEYFRVRVIPFRRSTYGEFRGTVKVVRPVLALAQELLFSEQAGLAVIDRKKKENQ